MIKVHQSPIIFRIRIFFNTPQHKKRILIKKKLKKKYEIQVTPLQLTQMKFTQKSRHALIAAKRYAVLSPSKIFAQGPYNSAVVQTRLMFVPSICTVLHKNAPTVAGKQGKSNNICWSRDISGNPLVLR